MIVKYVKSTAVIILLCLFIPAAAVYGQAQAIKQAEGVDLILMIDESGSMGGYGEHPHPNDPHNKRNELLHIMLPYIVESSYRGNVFRISLIEFGSRTGSSARYRPAVTLSMYKIQQPATGESRSDYLQRVSQELAHLRADRTRGYSDHGAAFQLAVNEIGKLKNIPLPPPIGQSGTNHRLTVIFLITDGLPFVKDANGTPIAAARLKQEIKQKISGFPGQDAVLFVFGLNDADKYWDELGYGTFWDLIAATTSDNKQNKGYAQFVSDHKKIVEQVLPVLTRYTNPPGLEIIKGDTFDCPPYLKSVQFVIEFPRSHMKVSQGVEIIQPDQTPLNTANAKEKKVYATIDVPYPLGGVWRFNRKDPDIKLMVKKTFQQVQFVGPVSPVHMRSNHAIRFKASGSGPNQTFAALPNFPLQAIITVTDPNNRKDTLNAAQDPNQPGVFVSAKPMQFQDAGEYLIQFEASVISGAGTPLTVLTSANEKIQVTNSTPLELMMEEPDSKIRSTTGSLDENFSFGFYTDNGNTRVPLQDVFNGSQQVDATLEVLDASGNLVIAKTDFSLKPENDKLTGFAQLDLGLMELFNIITGDRTARITAKIDQRHIKGSYFLSTPQNPNKLYQFQRELGAGMLLYLFLIAGALIILMLAAWLLYLFSKHECSKDVPLLVYCQESGLVEDDGFTRTILVDNKKIHYRNGDFGLTVPEHGSWTPEITIKRNCTDEGVAITLEYERFGKTPADKKSVFRAILEKLHIRKADPDNERMCTVNMQTRYPRTPFIHRIEELKDIGMIFELRIQGKEGY